MVHFLFTPVPAAGHMGPAMVLADEVARRGHDVTVATGSRYRARVERSGARFVGFENAPELDFEHIDEHFPERPDKSGVAQFKFDAKRLTIDQAIEEYTDLRQVVDADPPDVVVSDLMGFAGQFLAEDRDIPLALLNAVHLLLPSVDTFPDSMFGPSSTTLGRLRNRTANWLVFDLLLRDVNRHLHETRARLGLRAVSASFMAIGAEVSQLILQPTVPEFEYPRSDLPPQLHFIGSLLPPDPPDWEPPKWWPRLDDGRPVVLVTQGTIATDPNDLIRPTLAALADDDVLVIAATGGAPAEGLGDTPANAVVEPFVPFGALMPHVDVMVTNGGYGGIHYALATGVPLVAAGKSEDKMETTARIEWSGAGINLNTKRPEPNKLGQAVRTVLHQKRYRDRARSIGASLAELDGPQLGAELLEQLASTGRPVLRTMDPW